MKLGTETASLVNHVYGRSIQPSPSIGMACTILLWTDRKACTVIGIDGDILHVQEDHVQRVDANGMSDCQTYHYAPNIHGITHTFKKTEKGYREAHKTITGRWQLGSFSLVLGRRDHHHDFSF